MVKIIGMISNDKNKYMYGIRILCLKISCIYSTIVGLQTEKVA